MIIKAPCSTCQQQLAKELSELPADAGIGILDVCCVHHGVGVELTILNGVLVNWTTFYIADEDDWRRLISTQQLLRPDVLRVAKSLAKNTATPN